MEYGVLAVRRRETQLIRALGARSRRAAVFNLVLLVLVVLVTIGCQKADRSSALLERVEPREVCMVNNRYMGSELGGVVVESRTYYGACPMCEQRLKDEPEIRVATDPVSRRRVDKASAVIGKLSSDKVLYFESEKTFAAYRGDE